MLAYAAQGRETDKGAAAGRNVREYLDKMAAALEGSSAVVNACARPSTPLCRRSAPRSSRPSTPTRASRSRRSGSCSHARTSARSSIDNLERVDSFARAADRPVRRRRSAEAAESHGRDGHRATCRRRARFGYAGSKASRANHQGSHHMKQTSPRCSVPSLASLLLASLRRRRGAQRRVDDSPEGQAVAVPRRR